jgi:tRNA pseudouridine-54 N-methylase
MPLHLVNAYPEKDVEVAVVLRGKTIWAASGTFQGESLSVTARSEASAVRQWIEVAESRYRSS